jgi:hypothetical protein
VHAASLNARKSWTGTHRHRPAATNHRTVCGESGMSREASRGSAAATLSPRR